MSAERVNPKLINTVSGVLKAAMAQGNREAYSLAFVLESAGLLQSPESAAEQLAVLAEVDKLRLRVAELVAQRDDLLVEAATAPDMDALVRERDQYRDETIVLLARVGELEAAAGDRPPQKGDYVRLPDGATHRVARTWASGRDLRVELDNGISRFAAAVTVVPAPAEDPQDEGMAPHPAPCRVPASPDCTCAPLSGELAEQRHLVDPLDHTLEHLADERPTKCGCGHTASTHRPGGCIADAVRSGLIGLCGCTAEVTA